MMKPGSILLCLIGAVVAASGWGHAWKQAQSFNDWKAKIGNGAPVAAPAEPVDLPFSDQEEIMFSLQDQIEILGLENRDLRAQVEELKASQSDSPEAPTP